MRSADWIISEIGLQNLMSAGISIGWLKAWLYSAGATDVGVHLLTSKTWQSSTADWQIFFASLDELHESSRQIDDLNHVKHTVLKLENPSREVCCYAHARRRVLFLAIGDIAYQRHTWLAFLNDGKALSALYVCAGQAMAMPLETGLSAGLRQPSDGLYLNATGLLIEEQVIATLKQHKLSIRTVESCSAGGIAARLCRLPGASAVVDRAWVTYSNAAKQQEVGVHKAYIDNYGAVSKEVVTSMAEGGAGSSHLCVAVSGIAGPSGGSADKPVGTVWIAVALNGHITQSQCLKLGGARHEIQHHTVVSALCLLLNSIKDYYG